VRVEGRPSGLAVVDDEAEVALGVGRAGRAGEEREELVAHREEGDLALALDAREGEDRAVEGERGVDVADLEGDVVDADEARAGRGGIGRGGHATDGPPGRSSARWI